MSAPESYRGHRFPIEVVEQCIWLYFRFALSYRDVEEMLVERLAEDQPAWAKRWLKEKVWSQSVSASRWKDMIGEVPHSDLIEQVERVCKRPSANIYQDHDAHLLRTFGGYDFAAELFQRLLHLDSVVRGDWHDVGLNRGKVAPPDSGYIARDGV